MNRSLLCQLISELTGEIHQYAPESLIYCTGEPVPALEELSGQGCQTQRALSLEEVDNLPRVDMGVVFDFLESCDFQAGTQLLCRLRNLKCDRVWVAIHNDDLWNLDHMVGLGFQRRNTYRDGDEEIATYLYDIATYNRSRDWNNPRFWANPENWGKYRW